MKTTAVKKEEPQEDRPTKHRRPRQVAHDETPSQIVDHKFSPKGEWYSLCRHCNLSEAAHAESELHYYGDDNPDDD